ncbi:hypothetical protein OWV82_016906 [Melia azedarach]|uniref:Uncharacterized protein n=1 Tax=Melia azedarach TaxID=155640 RepID=A0ACC1XH62_MELAZ|nr:hypothetical protein OWV82_016906 [Melia azedarach]
MQLWPIPTQEHFPVECLLVISMLSNFGGSSLIFSLLLNHTWAVLVAAVYTYAVSRARNIRVPFNSVYVGLFVSYFCGLLYFNTTSWGLLLFVSIHFCFSFFFIYIPLLYDLYDGIIGYGDLCGTFLYLLVKAFSLKVLWASTKLIIDQEVASWLVGFIGLVLLLDSFLFRKQFYLLKLQRVRTRRSKSG